MKKIFVIVLALVISKSFCQTVPTTISYQGYLEEGNQPVNNQSRNFIFEFYTVANGTLKASRNIAATPVKGLFSVIIGEGNSVGNEALPIDIWGEPIKVKVKVGPAGSAIDLGEYPLTTSPYAFSAAYAQTVNASNITAGTLSDSRLEAVLDLGAINASGNVVVGGVLSGNGSGLTSLNAANITGTNTLPASVLPTIVPIGNGTSGGLTVWTGTGTVGSDGDLSWNASTNTLSATNLAGNGVGITGLSAANIAGANSLPASVLPTTVPQGNGSNNTLTIWTGTGTVAYDSDLSWNNATNTLLATNFSGNGSSLTSLSAANITGTNALPSAVLPTNVPLGNGAATALTYWTGTGSIGHDTDLSWNATTNTLSAMNFNGSGSAMTFNGLSYSFPGSHGTGTRFLTNDGTGILTWTNSVSGSQIGTGIDATNITSNTLDNARLDPEIADLGDGILTSLNIGGSSQFSINSTGDLTKINNVPYSFPSSQGVANSFLSNNGSGTLTWTNTLPLANGGTGATNATGARSTLGAAASGSNSDITSLSALSTPLSTSQGGTGVAGTLTGVLLGNGSSAVTSTAASAGSQYLRRNSANTSYEFAALAISSSDISDGTITNSDIHASASIAGTKINPDFGTQNIATTGTSSASEYNYSSSKTRNLVVNQAAFSNAGTNSAVTPNRPIDGTTLLTYILRTQGGSSGVAAYFNAAVDLPDGATVTGFSAMVFDNDASNNVVVRFGRSQVTTLATVATLATASSSGASTSPSIITSSAFSTTIDNANYSYFIVFQTTEANLTMGLYNVKLTYTVSKPE